MPNPVKRPARHTKADPVGPLHTYDKERLVAHGARFVGGLDEAGRGALAGPVVAAVVVFDGECRIPGLNDSKQLSPARRGALFEAIQEHAVCLAVGEAGPEEVDRINVLQATLLAASRALSRLNRQPDVLLTDYLKVRDFTGPVEPIAKGDATSQAIAAASIIAKVTRDRYMERIDQEYPEYGFVRHKGYGARAHIEALMQYGSSTIHRHSFQGVDWFDTEHRISRTLARLMVERSGTNAPHDHWRKHAAHLPEVERQIYLKAWGDKP